MTVVSGRTWLEYLSPPECWARLSECRVGRVGVLVDSAPEIYPVNFVVDDKTIVFRTDPGNKLRNIGRSPSVCFEVDAVDVGDRTGWSVLVKGRGDEIQRPSELRHVATLALEYWALGDKTHWIRIRPAEITGRRIHHPQAAEHEAARAPAPNGGPSALL